MKKRLLVWIPATILAGLIALCSGYRTMTLKNQSLINRVSNEEKVNSKIPEDYLELLNNNEIIIKNVVFNPAGFVVVREEVSGNPSEVVGISDLVEGWEKAFVVIPLSKEIKRNDVIYINYFVDDGDGKFDPQFDMQKETLLGQNSYIKLVVLGDKKEDPLEPNL